MTEIILVPKTLEQLEADTFELRGNPDASKIRYTSVPLSLIDAGKVIRPPVHREVETVTDPEGPGRVDGWEIMRKYGTGEVSVNVWSHCWDLQFRALHFDRNTLVDQRELVFRGQDGNHDYEHLYEAANIRAGDLVFWDERWWRVQRARFADTPKGSMLIESIAVGSDAPWVSNSHHSTLFRVRVPERP